MKRSAVESYNAREMDLMLRQANEGYLKSGLINSFGTDIPIDPNLKYQTQAILNTVSIGGSLRTDVAKVLGEDLTGT